MKSRHAVVLAAGKGTRMKSSLYKVLHPVCGRPMIEHVIQAVQASGVDQIVTIVGHGAEAVQDLLGTATHYALQEDQLGTGHAVLQAADQLANKAGATLVICGDTPLLTQETLNQLFDYHESAQAAATILTAQVDQPTGYGRVVRDGAGQVAYIVEEKDANAQEKLVTEINTGTYVFDNQWLFQALQEVGNDNAQGEYYLPDVIAITKEADKPVAAYLLPDSQEAIGVNDRQGLAEATAYMQARINRYHMSQGVTLQSPANTYIEAGVSIGPDTVIEAGVQIKGANTQIGSNCLIGSNSVICDSQIADSVRIEQSVVESSQVDAGSYIGPFAHLRPNTELGKNVRVGNFVEVKNSKIGDDSHASHLTYVGDSQVGQRVNLGCGTVFVNFDGKNKYGSMVGDDVFIGCNVNLVAPVEIGDRAFLAAGSTITKDVPAEALAIERGRQQNIENYWSKLQAKEKE